LNQLQQPDFAEEHAGYFGFELTGADRESASWGWPGWIFGTRPPVSDATGHLNFAGLVLPESADRGRGPNQFILGEQFFKFIVMNDPGFDARSLGFEEAQRLVNEKLGDLLDADDTNLGTYVRLGGKLLIWHGGSDPAIPPAMSVDLYERTLRDTSNRPGAPPVEESVRLFLAPGMQHCLGGSGLTGFDMLDALDAWVTQGERPERVDATQHSEGKPVRSRPLCAYPKTARYLENGNPDSASSFVCR
jgi:feruloyl esterase